MADLSAIGERLHELGGRIVRWREAAETLRQQAATTGVSDAASTDDLVEIETMAGDIYAEIEAFKQTLVAIGETSPAAAGELAEVGEALHLLLLEITEQGTKLYSSRSGLPEMAAAPAAGVE